MASTLNPYISFRNQARDAMQYYQSVFGGELTSNTFAEFGAATDPAESDNIMHAQLTTPAGFTLMGADVPAAMDLQEGQSITVSLSGDDEAELRGYWDGLSDGATVGVPLEKAPWGDTFGMLTDRFGVGWMVNIAGSPPS